jgi:hypothetical protein
MDTPAPPLNATSGKQTYDEWLIAKVQQSLDDPRPSIPNDEVKRHFAAKREGLRKRIEVELV